jgi:hypothetical protein
VARLVWTGARRTGAFVPRDLTYERPGLSSASASSRSNGPTRQWRRRVYEVDPLLAVYQGGPSAPLNSHSVRFIRRVVAFRLTRTPALAAVTATATDRLPAADVRGPAPIRRLSTGRCQAALAQDTARRAVQRTARSTHAEPTAGLGVGHDQHRFAPRRFPPRSQGRRCPGAVPSHTPASGTAEVAVTFHGGLDNDPPGTKDIAYPKARHANAAGIGSYQVGSRWPPTWGSSHPARSPTCQCRASTSSWKTTAPNADSQWHRAQQSPVDLWTGLSGPGPLACQQQLRPDRPQPLQITPPANLPVDPRPLYFAGRDTGRPGLAGLTVSLSLHACAAPPATW